MTQGIRNKPKSCIKHPDKTPLVLLRAEYLEITGNHCAAKLLAIFEFWTNKLNAVGEALGKAARDWIYKSLEALHNELMGEHGIHTIRKAIDILESLGFITKRHNPHVPYDRTWQYRLEVERVQDALDSLNFHSEQMEESELINPISERDESICQNGANNNIEINTVLSEEKTERNGSFEKTEEEEVKIVQHISRIFKVGYQQAEYTLNFWKSEWHNRPTTREWLIEKLESIGLSTSILS